MRFIIAIVAVIASTYAGFAAPACRDAHGTYTNSSGHEIRDPACVTGHIPGETAICQDGSHSMSEHRRGTCSRHGGVAQWE